MSLGVFFAFNISNYPFKLVSVYFHHNVGIHLYKPPVQIIHKPRITRFFDKSFRNIVIQTQIQYCIHHSGIEMLAPERTDKIKGFRTRRISFSRSNLPVYAHFQHLAFNFVVHFFRIRKILSASPSVIIVNPCPARVSPFLSFRQGLPLFLREGLSLCCPPRKTNIHIFLLISLFPPYSYFRRSPILQASFILLYTQYTVIFQAKYRNMLIFPTNPKIGKNFLIG